LNDCQTVDQCKELFMRYFLYPQLFTQQQQQQQQPQQQQQKDQTAIKDKESDEVDETQFMNDLFRHRKSKKPLRWG